jgi:DNA-binding PadR family transcriptional regulator
MFKNLHDKFHENIEEIQKLRGLRIWILHVLDDSPKNGVEIMDSIQEHHEQMYRMHQTDNNRRNHHLKRSMMHHSKRPSPGSVYPILKKMVDENLIVKGEDGRYALTQKGQLITHKLFGHLRPHGKQTEQGSFAIKNALTEIDGYVSYLEDIKKEKLILHEELIGNLSERLKNIKESFHEE